MANVLVQGSSLTAIADAIREKNQTTNTYKPAEMSEAIKAIETGGGNVVQTNQVNTFSFKSTASKNDFNESYSNLVVTGTTELVLDFPVNNLIAIIADVECLNPTTYKTNNIQYWNFSHQTIKGIKLTLNEEKNGFNAITYATTGVEVSSETAFELNFSLNENVITGQSTYNSTIISSYTRHPIYFRNIGFIYREG